MDSSIAAKRDCSPAKSKIPPEFVDSGAERREIESGEVYGHGNWWFEGLFLIRIAGVVRGK
jgi:hypothetical protein